MLHIVNTSDSLADRRNTAVGATRTRGTHVVRQLPGDARLSEAWGGNTMVPYMIGPTVERADRSLAGARSHHHAHVDLPTTIPEDARALCGGRRAHQHTDRADGVHCTRGYGFGQTRTWWVGWWVVWVGAAICSQPVIGQQGVQYCPQS